MLSSVSSTSPQHCWPVSLSSSYILTSFISLHLRTGFSLIEPSQLKTFFPLQERLVREANAAAVQLKAALEAAASELDRVRAEVADGAAAAADQLRSGQEAAAAELDQVRREAAQQVADAK